MEITVGLAIIVICTLYSNQKIEAADCCTDTDYVMTCDMSVPGCPICEMRIDPGSYNGQMSAIIEVSGLSIWECIVPSGSYTCTTSTVNCGKVAPCTWPIFDNDNQYCDLVLGCKFNGVPSSHCSVLLSQGVGVWTTKTNDECSF